MSREQGQIKPVTIIIIIVSIGIIVSLIRNAAGLYQSRSRLEQDQAKIANLEQRKQQVAQQLKDQTDPAALDQVIRNKLNVSLPGETVVILTGTESAAANSTPSPSAKVPDAPITEWWQLFTHPNTLR